jgi:hypothetical protein
MFATSFFNGLPYFISPSENNFKFTNSASALSNSGNPSLSLPNDLENNPRNSVPDIGVYEVN